ncbi:helix-turn-helix domain-containing protein [Mesorhizobium sp. ANAO-SY3R2]|uniref:helix-turn-helix domain-containing protein n=1 Tax=Mesorhizobium sp. ANAO-SY3R2 TaxID=3166644 RepID=UPI00366BA958
MIAYTASKIATREFTAKAPLLPTRPQPLHFFAAGTEIYGQNELAGCIYQVEFGAIRIYRLLADGRRQISSFHLPGETFGLEVDDRHHFCAEAISNCGIRKFSLASHPEMSGELLSLALQSLGRAQDHLLVLARQAACERVGAFLLELAERQGGTNMIELPMSRMDIGDYLGLTIETVSRIFSKLKEQGIIRLPSLRCIEIMNWDALHSMNA